MRKYKSIQVLRGLAALLVVVHHSSLSINAFVEYFPESINSFFSFGYLGVDLFFVLSGFIILSSHFNDKKSFFSLKKYVIKRFSRIWPPYIIISSFMIFLYFIFPFLSKGDRGEVSLLSSIFLLPSLYPPALSVSWTLIHEVFFYFLFCAFFFSSVYFNFLLFLWIVGIVLLSVFDPSIKNTGVVKYYFSFINIEFVFGMIACLILKIIKKNHIQLLLSVLFVVIVVLLFLFFQLKNDFRVIASLFFSSLIMFFVSFENYSPLTRFGFFVMLGDASYSIYLIHNPLISLISRMLNFFNFFSWSIHIISMVFFSIFFGIIYHKFVEKPVTCFFKKNLSLFFLR